MKKSAIIISCILLAIHSFCFSQDKKSKDYEITNTFSVEGDGGWDLLIADPATNRIFVSHHDVTQVIDGSTGELLGTIEGTKGVHGIALDQNANRAFISCGKDNSITVINLKSLETITKIESTGINPDDILYDKFSDKVFVFNARSNNATVLNPNTNEVITTIAFAGNPELSVSDEQGKVYVNIEDKSLVTVINAMTLEIENTWPLSPGEEPTGLSLDNSTHRLFSVCSNELMVVLDTESGKIITTLQTGKGTDGCVFDPELKRAYSSNGRDGTLTVVQEENANDFSILNNFPTKKGARTICLNPKTHHLYLPTAEYEPAPESQNGERQRPTIISGTFAILDIVPQ